MLDCLILGDSIAVGVHQRVPNCGLYAKVGITSSQWNRNYRMMRIDADKVVISLGSNDYKGINTELQLRKLRKRVDANSVVWIIPAGVGKNSGVNITEIQKIVRRIARDYDDVTVMIPELSKDRIHPTTRGYNKLGEIIK